MVAEGQLGGKLEDAHGAGNKPIFSQMRHIQRLAVEGQSAQVEMDGVVVFANGMVC